MGEMIPGIVLKAAILGFHDSGDRVLEVLEYPKHPGRPKSEAWSLTDHGFSHVGLLCDDIAATRARLEARGVRFLTRGTARITGLETAWFEGPVRKRIHPDAEEREAAPLLPAMGERTRQRLVTLAARARSRGSTLGGVTSRGTPARSRDRSEPAAMSFLPPEPLDSCCRG